MSLLGAVIGFFSPSNYQLPKKHLQTTISYLLASGLHVAVAQVVRPGQKPEPLPPGVSSGVWYTEHTYFYKENLWNLGATLLPHDYLLFIDSDILISHKNWASTVLEKLNQYDLIQPFEIAAWQNRAGDGIEFRRRCSAFALAAGIDPRVDKYHPGFSWAATRDAFNKMGGWYDFHPAGGGDTATVYALTKREYGEYWAKRVPTESYWWQQKSFHDYRNKLESLNLKIGFCENFTATHMWHGSRKNRLYVGRSKFLPPLQNNSFPLIRRKDGLLEWADFADSLRLQEYFDFRREDG